MGSRGRSRSRSRSGDRGRGGGRGGGGGGNPVSLIVRNLPLDTRPEELGDLFGKYGRVRDIYIPKDFHTKRPKGFAFIEFAEERDGQDAIYYLDRSIFGGREMNVGKSREGRKRPEQMMTRDGPPGRGRRRSRSRSRSRRRQRSPSRSRSRTPARRTRSRSRSRSASRRPQRSLSKSPARARSASGSPRGRSPAKSMSPSPPARDTGVEVPNVADE